MDDEIKLLELVDLWPYTKY